MKCSNIQLDMLSVLCFNFVLLDLCGSDDSETVSTLCLEVPLETFDSVFQVSLKNSNRKLSLVTT